MKKLFIFLCCVLVLLPCVTCIRADALYESNLPDYAPEIFYLVNVDTDTVVIDKNSTQKAAPASLTKIITGILAIEFCENLDTVITVPQYAVDLLLGTDSSIVGLLAGETITMRDLLYCLLLPSANDAANVIADYIGKGSIEDFVYLMNDFARAMGCTNTHFDNAHGLDSETHYTCAADMYKMLNHAIKNSVFCEIIDTYEHTVPATGMRDSFDVYSTNALINSYSDYYYRYSVGGKTGSTDDAGMCLASVARKDGYTYIAVAMRGAFADTGSGAMLNTSMVTSADMFRWAFEHMKLKIVADTSRIIDEVPVLCGKDADYVALVPEKEMTALVANTAELDGLSVVTVPESKPENLMAPVQKGQVVAKAYIYYSEEVIAEVNLITLNSVEKSASAALMYALKQFFTSRLFFIILAVVVAAIIAAVSVILKLNSNKRKRIERERRATKADIDLSKLK